MRPRICLIEDDPYMGDSLVERFELEGLDCDWFQRGRDALLPLRSKPYALVISDIQLPDISGEALFTELVAEGARRPPFLFITGHGAIDQAVRLLKLGAEDYLTKPLDIPLLLAKVRQLVARAQPRSGAEPLLGISSAMRAIDELLPRVAAQAKTVLITGESGVGKEVIARAFHDHARAGKTQPFVAVNCGAISETLLEAELFGHEKGAFTGAVRERRGTFEQADGGTLFLDEIGDMPLTMQVKLLRVIQERSIVRVGGERAIPVAIRLVCATHRDLLARVADGRFREDLYYRIHVVQLHIPPLRERREDILWLADRILRELADGRPPRRLDAAAEQALLAADWPGNVRELRHCLERACILDGSPVLGAASLAGRVHKEGGNAPPLSLADHVAQSERRHIAETLSAAGGRIGEAAARLGISRKTLWEKMRRHGLSAEPSD
jgi:DNA-binding NtrC family response regulator